MSEQPSAWAIGWASFAGWMLILTGVFQGIAGIAGIAEDEIYVEGRQWVLQLDATTWGWVHLVVGILLVLVGAGILTGNLLARMVGVLIAGVSAITAFAYLPWYPVWGAVLIAIDVAIIWALTAHGRDVEMVG
ncbi:hypothetical protein PO878_20085 [Iamia majanohamensis]|uniref:DUF7144 domain-containing protein n=1 Tax=Iamia majanohamensis TaxID=467976 RepID=A0AAE9Y5G8_9ACTN|nr:hypothetical protein [Iamia majanohamensis]WCO66795.1 hypothetical protein PO878_20085 [Iamia majanohamensis]